MSIRCITYEIRKCNHIVPKSIKTAIAASTALVIAIFTIPTAKAEGQAQLIQKAQHQQKGNTSVYFLGLKYCRNAKELPTYFSECSLFKDKGDEILFPCYVSAYVQHFHGTDHDGSIIGGIDFVVEDPNDDSRNSSIKLNFFPEVLAAVKPILPADFVPTEVDKMFFKIIQTDQDHVPKKIPVTITAGFNDEEHEFKFIPE